MNKDINDRNWPKKWSKEYVPKASEDACRYCKWGFLDTNISIGSGKEEWACDKPFGNFLGYSDEYCGHFKRLGIN
jgi:hypothetical protein